MGEEGAGGVSPGAVGDWPRARVDIRVNEGGHSVPPDKIESRYYRSLELLPAAIRASHRAYIFDNSGDQREHTWLAEITDGKRLELKSEIVPGWFKESGARSAGR